MFWEIWGFQKLSNQILVLGQSQTKTSTKTHLAKLSNRYPKDCLLVQNQHTTNTKKHDKKVLVSCKVQQILQKTNTGYFKRLFTDYGVAHVIGTRRLTQFCAPLVLRQMHTTLACAPGLCGTLVTLLHPIWMFLCLWVSMLMTLSTSRRIPMLRCCSNVYYGKG